eukprot:CAMPEP_0185021886 /NCGR_PEP_ID=MMETSP1103-20130426/4592_1 /TAXON_ID=36769 /ORGANISM="Paraphysomonas bandaiensis, Strain Caron Lab Isolate" /LENGTH=124 /DNA_ID=CAMNT_0027553667 /DNA_START=50 /DNA_END=424 /DNA_ORIENTATION=-
MAPFARILAQLIIQGGSILTRAVFTAYQQALRNAKAGGGAASTATAVVRRKMNPDEAMKILNIEKAAEGEISKVKVNEQYEKYYKANDPSKGGSFYLQSKIYRAKEALIKEAMDEASKTKGPTK